MEICAEKGIDPKKTQIRSWIDAVGLKKNKILGFPKLRASDIIGIIKYLVIYISCIKNYRCIHILFVISCFFCILEQAIRDVGRPEKVRDGREDLLSLAYA